MGFLRNAFHMAEARTLPLLARDQGAGSSWSPLTPCICHTLVHRLTWLFEPDQELVEMLNPDTDITHLDRSLSGSKKMPNSNLIGK